MDRMNIVDGPVIDAHIHLDLYDADERRLILSSLEQERIEALISVSIHLESCQEQLRLKRMSPDHVYPAFGYHPEQALPSEEELEQLTAWIREHRDDMVAIGEVGLPYYRRKEAIKKGDPFDLEPYVRLLRHFIELAAELDKPVVLHAIYEDADVACDVLEKCGWDKAHFHWFRGSAKTLRRIEEAGYYVSIAPDIAAEAEVRAIVRAFPLERMMAETDGPWKFSDQMTHPSLIRNTIKHIATLKQVAEDEVARKLIENARTFYQLQMK